MTDSNEGPTVLKRAVNLFKLGLLAAVGAAAIVPSAIIAIGVYYCTGGKTNDKYRYPYNRNL